MWEFTSRSAINLDIRSLEYYNVIIMEKAPMAKHNLTDFELGWLVGYLEGEGSFQLQSGRYHRVDHCSTDEDVVLKAIGIIEKVAGQVKDPWLQSRPSRSNQVPIFKHTVSGKQAVTVMRLVVSHMSWRRRQRIWQCLNGYVEPKNTMTAEQMAEEIRNVMRLKKVC